uniref:Putative kDa family member n=1 Tax=Rhipicephalus microplus TaxID=6941 RepID=A0A6G5A5W3_RHIMP
MSILHKCLLITTAVLCTRCGICNAYMQRAAVEIKNGHCTFQGRAIPVNQSISLKDPCEEWTCDHESNSVSITGLVAESTIHCPGCSPMAAGRGCQLVGGKGDYPDCCSQMLCY